MLSASLVRSTAVELHQTDVWNEGKTIATIFSFFFRSRRFLSEKHLGLHKEALGSPYRSMGVQTSVYVSLF